MDASHEGVITQRPDDVPRVRGTRITIYDVMDYYGRGRDVDYIAEVLRLTVPDVRAAIAYIEAHRADVDAVYAKILARAARGNPPEIEAKLAESRRRALARLAELCAAKRAAAGERDAAAAG